MPVSVIVWVRVPLATNAPCTISLSPAPAGNCTLTPGSIVYVRPAGTLTGYAHDAGTVYGLLAKVNDVSLRIGPQSVEALDAV